MIGKSDIRLVTEMNTYAWGGKMNMVDKIWELARYAINHHQVSDRRAAEENSKGRMLHALRGNMIVIIVLNQKIIFEITNF